MVNTVLSKNSRKKKDNDPCSQSIFSLLEDKNKQKHTVLFFPF